MISVNLLSTDIHNLMIKFKMEYDVTMERPDFDVHWNLMRYENNVLSLFQSLTWQEQIYFSVIYPVELSYNKLLDDEQISARNLMI